MDMRTDNMLPFVKTRRKNTTAQIKLWGETVTSPGASRLLNLSVRMMWRHPQPSHIPFFRPGVHNNVHVISLPVLIHSVCPLFCLAAYIPLIFHLPRIT